MDSPEFSRQLQKLQKEIFNAILSYRVYIALWPTTEVVDILNRHGGFFKPVRNALYHTMMMGFAKVSDRNKRTASLRNLLRAAKYHRTDLVPGLSASEIQDMNDNLSLQKTVLEKIKRIRDESLAHLDAKFEPSSPPTVGEMNSLISTIEKIFNRLSSGHNRNVYSWSFQANRSATQTANILDILQEEMRKRTAEAEEAIQDSRNA